MATSTTVRTSRASARRRATPGIMVTRGRTPVATGRWLAGAALRIVAAAVLPVITLVGMAVALYARGHGAVVAVLGGAAAALVVLAIAAASIAWHLTGRARIGTLLRWVALPVVVTWCAYALFHIGRANAKTAAVKSAYASLHPVLRLAVGTAILADGELVVTDASRTAADYRRMGLPVFDRTLHYRQQSGWVHAVDVRTIGHSEVRNKVLSGYFQLIGLRVVRHVGTADHLHVELPLIRR